jgi:hypothetical protein
MHFHKRINPGDTISSWVWPAGPPAVCADPLLARRIA